MGDKVPWVIDYVDDSTGLITIAKGQLGHKICEVNFGRKEGKRSVEVALKICRAVNSMEGRSRCKPLDSRTVAMLGKMAGKIWTVDEAMKEMGLETI